MKLHKSQSGIAHVLMVLLVVVVLGGIGFAGWKVYDSKKTKQSAQTTNANQKEEQKSTISEDWIEYKNEEYGFSFAYPKGWGRAVFYEQHHNIENSDEGWQAYFDFVDGTVNRTIHIKLFSDDGYSNSDAPKVFTKGYKLQQSGVYSVYNEEIVQKAVVKKATNIEYVLVTAKDLDPYLEGEDEGPTYAGVNLTKNPRYKGIQISTQDARTSTLLQILDTFKIIN